MRNFRFIALPILCILIGSSMAVAQNTTFPSEPISYYNGNSRTTINVALDELQVTNPANLQSLQTRGTARPDGENGARLRLSAPASSMSTISQTAAPLNAGNQNLKHSSFASLYLHLRIAASLGNKYGKFRFIFCWFCSLKRA